MSSALDMSLDDIIKSNKKSGSGNSRGRGRGGGGGAGSGPARRVPNRGVNRASPYATTKELFSEVGDLKRYTIHYDRSGRSKGTAEVVYSRRSDAAAAVKRYNNVQLDGKPMKIEIVGTNMSTPAPSSAVAGFGGTSGIPRGGQGRGGAFGRLRGGNRGRGGRGSGSGRGRGRGAGRDEKLSAEDLDADLEKYHAESMQIN
ncbi:hypothetical protein QQ045_032353 [Rhodiola kirilowii]